MEEWSDSPVIEHFKIKYFLDTNILVFLVDDTYTGVTKAIDILNKLEFVDLVSSKFVIFEFVGVRKKEHYLQKCVNENDVNISTLLTYGSKGFNIPEVRFEDIQPEIKTLVESELEKITNDFGIAYSDNLLHDDLLKPTFDVCLSSKLSKEDSLVLVSALLPEPNKPEKIIHLVSKDEHFSKSVKDPNLLPIYENHSLNIPDIGWIPKIELDASHVNLTSSSDDGRLDQFIPKKVLQLIISKNQDLYIGKTFTPQGEGFPANGVCFKLPLKKQLPNDIFLTIIGHDLSFIYSSKHRIDEFWHNGGALPNNFSTNQENQTNISFLIRDENGANLSDEMMAKIREVGNTVFIHPDSDI